MPDTITHSAAVSAAVAHLPDQTRCDSTWFGLSANDTDIEQAYQALCPRVDVGDLLGDPARVAGTDFRAAALVDLHFGHGCAAPLSEPALQLHSADQARADAHSATSTPSASGIAGGSSSACDPGEAETPIATSTSSAVGAAVCSSSPRAPREADTLLAASTPSAVGIARGSSSPRDPIAAKLHQALNLPLTRRKEIAVCLRKAAATHNACELNDDTVAAVDQLLQCLTRS